MKIKRAKLKFDKINVQEELDDAVQDLIDFSMQTSSTVDAVMEGQVRVPDGLVDKHFETVERLRNKLLRMYKLKK